MKVHITLQATGHLNAVYEYLHAIDSESGRSPNATHFRAIDRLKQFPRSGHVGRMEETRELMVPRTPLLMVYSLGGDQINILAILHGSQQWPRQPRGTFQLASAAVEHSLLSFAITSDARKLNGSAAQPLGRRWVNDPDFRGRPCEFRDWLRPRVEEQATGPASEGSSGARKGRVRRGRPGRSGLAGSA